ncbi:MAG: hypothetical protein Nkreftii_003829 [Candidatus Nitrospira kreftii]|uniref:Uncharacterized protein n=1 Tax=Candidatus Nitrospira kreftii TaxID=2652173 RepID=A0A7S8FHQ5_9BACT|nr:MAG: hypothetical protein Nkreftii_003829 [Candidatus Nitrospira kreftii]
MKRTTLAGLIITAILLVCQTVSAETIKLGTLAPNNSPYYDILRDLGEDWAKISNGSVRLRIYAGGVAGDDPDMVRKMRIGHLWPAQVSTRSLTRPRRSNYP